MHAGFLLFAYSGSTMESGGWFTGIFFDDSLHPDCIDCKQYGKGVTGAMSLPIQIM